MAKENSNEVLAAWETSSQYWTKYQALIEKMFATLSQALIKDAHISPGQTVLDVGGGSGEPSLTIAPIVGESGSVAYTDPAAGMVNAAQAEAKRRGLTNIRFNQCPADRLPFADDSFDAAVSRLSAMFFSDVLASLREMLRVVKPGGEVALVVWAARDVNPFFSVVTEVLDRFVPADVEDEDSPAAFRFARPGKLKEALEKAGAVEVMERELAFSIEAPIDVKHFWELRTEMSDTFRSKLQRLTPDQVAAIRYTVQKTVAPYFKTGGMSFPAKVLVISAKKALTEG